MNALVRAQDTGQDVRVSVAICTHNRASWAIKALESALAQTTSAPFEVIVVDSASQDDTQQLIGQWDDVTLLHEAEPGLSRARNRALDAARGAFVAFLDDDAVAEPGWIDGLLAEFERGGARCGCVGGCVLPDWGADRPAWLHANLLMCLSVVDWPGPGFEVEPPRYVVGANLAFRASALGEVGPFSVHLGRTGASLLSGEEDEMFARLRQSGYTVRYAPEAIVHHHIHAERLTTDWMLRRAAGQGVAEARQLAMDAMTSGDDQLGDLPGDPPSVGAFKLKQKLAARIHPDPQQRFFARYLLATVNAYKGEVARLRVNGAPD